MMKKLKQSVVLALMATGAMTGAAYAEPTFSGNVALTSDYMFRGVSQSDSDGAIQGGFDYGNGIFYAGTWASSIDFGLDGTLEIDAYAGVKPTFGPVTFDAGLIYYYYPGLENDAAEADMLEAKLAATIAPIEGLSITGAAFYSPDFTFTTGDEAGLYTEAKVAYTITDSLSVSALVGYQDVDQTGYFANNGDPTENYTTWNIGGTYSAYGFGFDVRYVDTDVIILGASGHEASDGRVVFTLSRAL